MDITNVLFTRRTGKIVPSADPWDNLFGMKLNARDYGQVEKTIDFTPIISVSDAIAGNALDYQFKITAVQTGTPSPQNICPIDGWVGAQITRAGRNLFLTTASSKEENGIIYTVNADGTISVSGTASGFSSINCGDADISGIHGKVTVSGIATATNMVWSGIRLYDANNVQLYDTGASSAPLITIDLASYPTAVKLTIVIKRQNNVVTSGVIKPQVEGGDTAHDFVPYETPTVYPVSWLSEAGTVYGGVLDVTTGTLTVKHAMVDLSALEWETRWEGTSKKVLRSELPKEYTQVALNGKIGLIAEQYLEINASTLTNISDDSATVGIYTYRTVSSGTSNYIFMVLPIDGTPSGKMVYPVAEPVTYTLTPTDIVLTEGANTLWSDTGDSKLTYLAKK